MKRRLIALISLSPLSAFAQGGDTPLSNAASSFIERVFVQILNPIIVVGFTLAIVNLAWSVFKYTVNSDKLEKEKLKSSLIYGVVGIFIMAAVFGIMKLIAMTVSGNTDVVVNNV